MMTSSERLFVTIFFVVIVAAILAVPFFGFLPIGICIACIICAGALAAFFNSQRDKRRHEYEAGRRPRRSTTK